MHSPNTTHTTDSFTKRLKERAKFIKRRISTSSKRRRLAVSAIAMAMVLTASMMLAGYYSRPANAAPLTASTFFTESYAGMTQGMKYLMGKLFGTAIPSPAYACTLTQQITVSGCYFTTGSKATVSVEVSWVGNTSADTITVSLDGGAQTRTINPEDLFDPGSGSAVAGPIKSPQVVAFEIDADGASHSITSTASGANSCTTGASNFIAPAGCAPNLCGSGELGGTVFFDYDADGIKDSGETNGASGVTVTAFDVNGTTYTATSDSSGRYEFSAANGNSIPGGAYPVRLEFTNLPAISLNTTTPHGTNNASSVQFASAAACTYDVGVMDQTGFCQSTPYVILPCYANGDPAPNVDANDAGDLDALIAFPYTASGGPTPGIMIHLATARQVGSLWGTAYNKFTKRMFSSAMLRRHVGLGPLGLGGIYVTNMTIPTSATTGNFIDVTALGIDLGQASVPNVATRGLSRIKTDPSYDTTVFGLVGKVGIGDLDISEDGNTLWFVNLFDKRLYSVDITAYNGDGTTLPTAANVSSTAIPSPGCANGEHRPWGTKFYKGQVYVGSVCDGSTGTTSDMRARISVFNPSGSTWSTAFEFPLTYPKGYPFNNVPALTGWYRWTDSFAEFSTGQGTFSGLPLVVRPQPILSDIEFDIDGSMVIGLGDRGGMQMGYVNYGPNPPSTSLYVTSVGGDVLRAFNSNGTFVLENNAKAGANTGFGPNNFQGPGFGEFYDDNWTIGALKPHTEQSIGALAIKPGSGEVVSVVVDPVNNTPNSGGVRWLDNSDGTTSRSYAVYSNSNNSADGLFGKAAGLGDVELNCDPVSYLEIGNRIWMDGDADGIQDPGEMPISGVTLRLYTPNGRDGVAGNGDDLQPIATAVTDSTGAYYFTSVDANNDGIPDNDTVTTNNTGLVGGGTANPTYPAIQPNTRYVIRADLASDYSGGALAGKNVTQANIGAGVLGSPADLRDSDATSANVLGIAGGNFPEIEVKHLVSNVETNGTGAFGEDDHTMDMGFVALSCTVAGATTVCNGSTNTYSVMTNPDPLTNPTYSWSVVNGGGANASISGANNGATVMVNSGTNAGTYTVMVTINSTEGSTSCSLTVTINNVTAGVVATDQTVCSGGDPAAFTVPTAATGSGTLTYQWQSSTTDCTTGFTNITGAMSATYDPPSGLTQTTYYRRIVTSTLNSVACTATSNCVTVSVNNVTPGVVAGDQAVCAPGDPVAFTVPTAATGSGTLTYQWQSSTVDCTTGFTNIPGAMSATYDPPSGLTQTTYYRRIATSTLNSVACSSPPSNCITVTFNPGPTANAGMDQELCLAVSGTTAFNLNGTGTNGNPSWAVFATTGTAAASIVNGSTLTPTINVTGVGTVTMRLTMTSNQTPSCGTATDDVVLTVTAMNLGNQVWKDLDNDGIRDTSPAEPVIDGVLMNLYRESNGTPGLQIPGDTLVTSQTTAGGGLYNFTGLPCADYYVQAAASNFAASGALFGCASSTGNVTGNSDLNDQDHGVDDTNPATNGIASSVITLSLHGEPPAGTDGDGNDGNLTADFGFAPLMNLGNLVWKDLDADGIRDTVSPNEPGVDGVKVVLWRDTGDGSFNSATDAMVAMQNTSGGGAYNFTGLAPGNYFVQIDSTNFGAGVLSTCLSSPNHDTGDSTDNNDNGVDNPTPTTGGVVSVLIPLIGSSEPTDDGDGNNGNLTVDFGFYAPMNLGNLVWKDLDADGVRDTVSPNEPGVDGVKVVLWRDNGDGSFNSATDTMVAMQNTSGGGAYNFTDLLPGNYFVQVDSTNFGAGVLSTCLSSPGNDSGDATDNNDNGVDNPTPTTGGVVSVLIPLISQSEPTDDGDGNNGNLTVDFGFYAPLNLGNLVWKDLDADGIRDTASPNEPGVDGVKVVLWRDNGDGSFNPASDTMVAMQNTSGGGAYNFTGLLPGNYFVQIDQSNFGAGVLSVCLSSPGNDSGDATDNNDNGVDNPTPTTGGVVSVLIPLIGQSEPTNDGDGNNGNLTVDFGFYPPMNLGNLVWKDLDGDGIRDTVSPNEPGVDGVKVVLWLDNGDGSFNSATDTMLTMQNTSGGGAYNFTNLLPGNYFVQVDESNFGAGVLSTCLSSPNHDTGDSTDNNDNGVDNPTPTTGGVVSVLIPLVGTTEPTNDGDGDNGNLTVDFGFYPPMNLGNLVWKDLDADGVRDTASPNEPGVDGVKVVLWRDTGDGSFNSANDTMVTMQNTSGGGAYNFTNLLPGTYFVQIDQSNFGAGVLSTCLSSPGADTGDTDNNDNGVDNPTPTTGGVVSTPVVLIGQSEPTDDGDGNNGNLTVDFGFYPPMNLGNLVWKDLDADGIRDTVSPNEPGVDGVKVVLWRDTGDGSFSSTTDTMVAMQNTSGGGAYNFQDLLPGNYFVQVDQSNFGAGVLSVCLSSPGNDNADTTDNNDNGVDNPTPTVGGVVSVLIPLIGQSEPTDDGDGNNGNLTADFGFYPPMNLGNLVWKDLDADGIRDTVSPNEPGVDGVKVVLWRDTGDGVFNSATDTMVAMQNTSGGGSYNFQDLLPGNYFVQIDSTNFGAGVLSTCLSSPGNDNADTTDNNDNGVDNPTPTVGGVVSVLIPLVGQSEPTDDTDGNNGNLTADFGFYPPMNLGNLVWKDLDADGVRDTVSPNEPGVDGVKVVLWRDNGDGSFNSATDTMVAMQNTSGGGSYNFQDLLPGNYFVQIDESNFGAGVLSTCLSSPNHDTGDATDNNDNGVDNPTPTVGGVVSVLISLIGQSEPTNDGDGNNGNLTVDFGFYPPMNLGNLVWKDLDADGVRDTVSPNEPGVDGVKVVLWRDNGDGSFNSATDTMVAMQNTSGGGSYNFQDLLPGNYFVQIDESNFGAGVLSTCLSSPNHDTGDATDNNDNGVDNPTPTVGGVVSVLISLIGQSEPTNDGDGNNGNLTVDFGFYPPMNLGNLIWKDLNGNGLRDGNPLEAGIDGVKVVLWLDNGDNTFSASDTMVAMQNTSGGGTYSFANLLPGTYFVEVPQSNFGPGQVLGDCLSSPGADTGDTDNDDNGVDNTTPTIGGIVSTPIVLIGQSEPTNDGDGNNGNLTIDFGFAPAPDWAFGNNPNGIPGKAYEGDPCNGATGTYVLTMTNLGPTAANPGAVMTDVIPTGITPIAASGVGWSCTISGQTVTCTSTTPLALNAMTQIRITVGIGYNISGPVTNTASIAYPGDPGTNNNTASTTINVVNGIGAPGLPFENNGSSVLVYPIYTSNSSNPNEQNTRINLTNIHNQKSICVHLFFVDGSSCSIADSIVCLTPNQTTSFLASDLDPGTTGYLVAVAIDCTGCPTNFNFLVGDEYVKFSSGHRGNIVAEGVAALPALSACNSASTTAALNFDGVSYGRFGRTLAADNFGSRADGNDTMIVVNRIGGNLATGAASLGTLFGVLYDDAEQALSFSVTGTCQLRSSLTNNFPRTTPRFETFIPAGRTGWLKLFSQSDIALVGAMINYNANAASSAGAFNGAHNLHKLTLSSAGSFIVPIFPPQGCQ